MVNKKFEVVKGNRDWYGAEAILRNKVRSVLRNLFEKYGYAPLETPILEYRETLAFKGGNEIQKEVFTLSDQGKRDLALRFDQTVPLARFISTHPEIKLPFKRYVIGEVFRDGPTQPDQGRYRSFTQCDVDFLGVKGMAAEAELIALAQDAFVELGLGGVEIRINNRKLLDGILDYACVPEDAKLPVIVTLDKMDKIGLDGVRKELCEHSSLNQDIINKILDTCQAQGSNEDVYAKLTSVVNSNKGKEGLNEVRQLLDYAKTMEFNFIKLDPSLARGLNYYTGTTIEVFLQDKNIVKSAILAGGRYDNMIGEFKGDDKEIPAVGFSFGLERIVMILSQGQKLKSSVTDLYLIPLNTIDNCLKIAHDLRRSGLNVDLALQNEKVGKCITYADSLGIPYVGIVGEDELKEQVVSIKNLTTGKQDKVRIESIFKHIRTV